MGWAGPAVALLLALALAADAAAQAFRITPRLSLEALYSDNIDLAPSGEEDDELIWVITPGVSIRQAEQGGRVKLSFDYAPQGLAYSSRQDEDTISHRLQGNATVEAVKNRLFVDARATAGQSLVTSAGRIPVDNVPVTDNRTDVYTFSIGPRWRQRLGDDAIASLSYIYDGVFYADEGEDSTSGRWSVDLDSGAGQNRYWNVSLDTRQVGYSEGEDTTYSRVQGTARYPIGGNWTRTIEAGLGYDLTQYLDGDVEDKGLSWNLGSTLRPTPRSTFAFGYGERYFGSNLYFNLSHRTHRTVWGARLYQEVTDARSVQLQQVYVPLVDEFGEPIVDPLTGEVFQVPIDQPTVRRESFVRNRLEGTMAAQGRRSTLSARVYAEDREYQLSDQDENVYGASLTLSRSLSRQDSATIGARWQQTDPDLGDLSNTLWDARLTYRHSFSTDFSGSVELRHIEQASDVDENAYTENRIRAYLTKTFN
jgi:uncharacterized protein (PEP-CTERM system associated)